MNKLDMNIANLLKKEGFDNDQLYYSDYETFEEIPLFSRWNHIEFLKKRARDDNNKLLISHAITLSKHAITLASNNLKKDYLEYFCCVTLTHWDCIDEINCITPNLYISRRKSWLLSNIKLHSTSSEKESIAKRYIQELGLSDYEAYISSPLGGDINRVYIINKSFLSDTRKY